MRIRNHGKYTKMRKNDPRGIARCDYSGLMVAHSTLKRQMQYTGTGLVWTGLMVDPRFADVPNPQELVPLIKLDPVPLKDPRPDSVVDAQSTEESSVGIFTLDVSDPRHYILTIAGPGATIDGIGPDGLPGKVAITGNLLVNGNNTGITFPGTINFVGVLTRNTQVFIPNTYVQFYANNKTTGPFQITLQIQHDYRSVLIIPPVDQVTLQGPTVVNTFFDLAFVNF